MSIRFAFGLHLHQPVGNFDSVFEDHVREVYLPFLDAVEPREFFPLSLHVSGPLLEWLERHDSRYLDRVGRLVSEGKLELLLAGQYEPVLAALPRADRLEQIGWMRDALRQRFGVEATGLWLTERVWEPDLAADLEAAGVEYALVDDRHFLATGFTRDQLHGHYRTESDGRYLALFPIDERLRYLIPFQPPEQTADYLRTLAAAGHPLAVLADDGEKFGGWPGTREWVYQQGWLERFFTTMEPLRRDGEVVLSTFAEALRQVPSSGLAYLPTASYREMEGWSLPAEAAGRLERLEHDLGAERMRGPDGAMVRGAHWRNFFVKYPESNRMHKKMLALSGLCRAQGDPPVPRRAIGRAQCNDAYWHGVFGGLYLPHLRQAIWANLAEAEGRLRSGSGLDWDVVDLDGDGRKEVWVTSDRFSALVAPHRGGALEELTVFAARRNYADVLTRRREAYHVVGPSGSRPDSGEALPSIHDLEASMTLAALPPADAEARALFVDRFLPGSLDLEAYTRAGYTPLWSGAGRAMAIECWREGEEVVIRLDTEDAFTGRFVKEFRFGSGGELTLRYQWDPSAMPAGALFAPELTVAARVSLGCTPRADTWTYPVETLAKSERGYERTVQGTSLTPRWPAAAGGAEVRLEVGEG